jgi:hypothetical protein
VLVVHTVDCVALSAPVRNSPVSLNSWQPSSAKPHQGGRRCLGQS